MPKNVRLCVLTPEKVFFDDEVTQIVVSAHDGALGVMAGYLHGITVVVQGKLKIEKDERWINASIGQGFMEVSDTGIEIFTDFAQSDCDNDIDDIRNALPQTEAHKENKLSHKDYLRTHAAVHRVMKQKKN